MQGKISYSYKGDTVVGNDDWIGHESLIMPGVTIGNSSIIASRSVVTANMAPYTIFGGNPAKAFKQRFDEATDGREDAVKSSRIDAWFGYQRCHAGHKIEELKDHVHGAILARCLELDQYGNGI